MRQDHQVSLAVWTLAASLAGGVSGSGDGPRTVAVFPQAFEGPVPAFEQRDIEQAIVGALRSASFTAVAPSAVVEASGVAACERPNCLALVGRAVGADYVTQVRVKLVERDYVFAAEVVDVATGDVYQGSVQLGEPGALVASEDTAVVFDVGAKASFGDVLDLDGPPSFSVEAWFRPDVPVDGWPALVEKLDVDQDRGWFLRLNEYETMSVIFVSWFGPGDNDVVYHPIDVGAWIHVVVTHDSQTLRMYVDGEEVSTAVSPFELADTQVPLTMGAYPDFGGAFVGALDEVAIYDHPLPPTRIWAHYLAGTGGV